MRRHDFLRELHRVLRPRNYLEIGVNDGKGLALSRVPTIGVDPEFWVTKPVQCDLQLVKATSDAFFERADPIRHLRSGRNPLRNARRGRPLFDHWRGGTTLDFAFIDGMHLFEYALRDFINVERFSRPTTVIAMDDMLPRRRVEALRGGNPDGWTGDVFKVALVLRELRPDLTLIPVDSEPTGVMLVLGADPTNTTLRERYDELEARWLTPDPQDVPIEILERRGTWDPETLLASEIWPMLARAHHGRGDRVLARVREALPPPSPGPRRVPETI
jgi:hypothetical protein